MAAILTTNDEYYSFTYNPPKMTLALIDGDVIAYMACEPRNLKRTATGEMVQLITLDPAEFTPEEDAIYLEGAWKRFQEIVTEICEIAFTEERRIAVKGDWCFRDKIFPEYKANRGKRPDKRNLFVPQLRKRAAEAGMAIEAHGFEADDLIRMWQQDAVKNGDDYAIFSIDKDLQCIPGAHYLLHKNQWKKVTEEEANRFYYEQLLKGDPTDNIRGIPGVGPVRAERLLEECETEEQMQAVVISSYQAAFEDKWKEELILTGNLIYLLKHRDDAFTIDNWVQPDSVVIKVKKEVDLPEVDSTVPIPVFNPNWGKK